MKKNSIVFIAFIAIVILSSCSRDNNTTGKPGESTPDQLPIPIKRFGMVTGIRPEMIEQYKTLHAEAWPKVLAKISECNIHNYSIYLKEIEGKHYLFSYFEYTGTDFTGDMERMAQDSTTQRWWRETGPTQIPLPDAAAKNETWSSMEEVFFTP